MNLGVYFRSKSITRGRGDAGEVVVPRFSAEAVAEWTRSPCTGAAEGEMESVGGLLPPLPGESAV